MLELFREEIRSHAKVLSTELLELERAPADLGRIEPLMRAAHSLKGACRIIGLDAAVGLAHDLEDVFVAAQAGKAALAAATAASVSAWSPSEITAQTSSVEGSITWQSRARAGAVQRPLM